MSTEQFHYTVPDTEKTVTLPHLKNIPSGVIRKLRKENDANQLFGVLEAVADKSSLGVTDELTMPQLEVLFDAWQKASEVTVGESTAS